MRIQRTCIRMFLDTSGNIGNDEQNRGEIERFRFPNFGKDCEGHKNDTFGFEQRAISTPNPLSKK